MGYPGQPTDEIMDLVRKLRNLAEARYMAEGNLSHLSEIDSQLDELESEIRSRVGSLDSSEDDYAKSVNY